MVLFQTHMGLSPAISHVLSIRSDREILRIEQVCHCVIDSFILLDPNILNTQVLGLKNIIRKIFKVGSTNLDLVIDYWKQITNLLYVCGARLEVSTPSVDRRNFFADILDFDEIDPWPLEKRQFERLMAFVSPRGLPPKSDVIVPRNKFKDLVSEPFCSDVGLVTNLAHQAGILGALGYKPHQHSIWHYSLNHAGSLLSSVTNGGKATEMMADYRSYYVDSLPMEDQKIETPFGDLYINQGVARWKTAFRRPEDFWLFESQEFPGSERTLDEFDITGRTGIDSAFADQVFYLAYLMVLDHVNSGLPLPVRVVEVHEQGGKTRVVSCAPWWSQVFLAPFGHFSQEVLKKDYDGNPCLYRSSPAWDSFISISGINHRNGVDCWLFSDMTSCTDAFPKDLASSLLAPFWRASGLDLNNELVQLAFNLTVSKRLGLFEDGTSSVMERGILMGEPMTKSLLTLFMCCLRRYSLVSYQGEFSPVPDWFMFHIGGDDHLVHGPYHFLRNIMDLVVRAGFIIDRSKHGISVFGGRYLQSPFFFREGHVDLKHWVGVFSPNTYDQAAYCDCVKTKLLGPSEKPHTARNELNVAIGKAKALGKTLALFNDTNYARNVRTRFIFRMGRLLPSQTTENSLWNLMLLPQELGGLGLALSDEERLTALSKCPLPTKVLVSRIISNLASYAEVKMHSRITTNVRWFSAGEDFSNLERMISAYIPDYNIEEFKFDVPNLPFLRKLEVLEKNGIYTIENLVDRILRLRENFDVVMGRPEAKNLPWSDRYWHLWDQYEKSFGVVDAGWKLPTEWSQVTKGLESLRLNRLKDGNYFPAESPFIVMELDNDIQDVMYCSFLEAVSQVYPALSVRMNLS